MFHKGKPPLLAGQSASWPFSPPRWLGLKHNSWIEDCYTTLVSNVEYSEPNTQRCFSGLLHKHELRLATRRVFTGWLAAGMSPQPAWRPVVSFQGGRAQTENSHSDIFDEEPQRVISYVILTLSLFMQATTDSN